MATIIYAKIFITFQWMLNYTYGDLLNSPRLWMHQILLSSIKTKGAGGGKEAKKK